MRIILTKAKKFKSSFPTLRTQCILDLQRFETFRNCCLFCTFWHLRNFYCGDAHHANYGKHSLNHHFQYWTHSGYQIYSVLKFFEIPVSFPPFAFRNFNSCDAHHANNGKHSLNNHFQQCSHFVYEIYSVLKLFKIAVCFAHLAFTKFVLWWCASCWLWQT